MSFRHFETGLRLTIDKNTNIPKVETVNDSRIYFSKCSKRKAFAIVRGFEKSAGICRVYRCFNEAQIKVVASFKIQELAMKHYEKEPLKT